MAFGLPYSQLYLSFSLSLFLSLSRFISHTHIHHLQGIDRKRLSRKCGTGVEHCGADVFRANQFISGHVVLIRSSRNTVKKMTFCGPKNDTPAQPTINLHTLKSHFFFALKSTFLSLLLALSPSLSLSLSLSLSPPPLLLSLLIGLYDRDTFSFYDVM